MSSRCESAESHGLPRKKENEMQEKPLTQAGGCSSRPHSPEDKDCVREKPCISSASQGGRNGPTKNPKTDKQNQQKK